jgi:hypothetical protein
MTDQPFLPWELARFKSERINGNEPAFLGELARIGRWWTGESLSGPRSARSFEVGYESATQFNREYGRFFGQPPMRDIRTLRSPGAQSLESVSNQ